MAAGYTFMSWMRKSMAIGEGEEVVIVSPYLGKALVEIIHQLQKKGWGAIKVFGLFTLQVFADRSSDFWAVKEVFELPGCQFFHVENLHAKFILFGQGLAVFGSQNVTKTKGFNLEFNCQTTDPVFLEEIKKTTDGISSKALPVTKGWFQLIEDHLEEVESQFERIVQVCAEKEKEIREENARVAEAEKKAKCRQIVSENLRDLEDKTSWYHAEGGQPGIILEKKIGPSGLWHLVKQDSGIPRSLLNWGAGGNFDPQRCKRFFCLFHNSEESVPLIGFARMTRKWVSFIANGFRDSPVEIPEVLSPLDGWKLDVSGLTPDETKPCNLRVVFKRNESSVKFDCLFLGHQLILNSSVESSGPRGDSFKKRIEGNSVALTKCLVEAVMDPFKYNDGNKIPDKYNLHYILLRTRVKRWKLRLGTPLAFSDKYFFRFEAHR